MLIIFRPLAHDDLLELRTWFEDAELSRRLSFPTDEWFAYVTAGAAACCWVALDADRTIAQVQVDREDSERGYLDPAVRPISEARESERQFYRHFCQDQDAHIRSWKDA